MRPVVDWTYTHFRILFDAYDSSNLAELLDRCEFHGGGPAREWPVLPLDQARDALVELLRSRYVVLAGQAASIGGEEAVRIVSRNDPWMNRMPDTNDYYEIAITEQGSRVYADEVLPLFWPEGNGKD